MTYAFGRHGKRFGRSLSGGGGAVIRVSDIQHYAQKSLDNLNEKGEMPDWIAHLISSAQTHMKDVAHFIRYRGTAQKRFGSPVDYSPIGHRNLRQIIEYAEEIGKGASAIPDWAMHKLSIVSEQLDEVGHFLAQEGRRFGVPGFTYGQPGWAGQGGVAQIPHPVGRGSGGGQGVQTYGSLGYGSMGDGSMDVAIRGGRKRFGVR